MRDIGRHGNRAAAEGGEIMPAAPDLDEAADAAGVDASVFAALMQPMPPRDRASLTALCRSDLETARGQLRVAMERWERPLVERQLHIVLALARTIGAVDLAEETQSMRDRVRDGEVGGLAAKAQRVDALLAQTCAFLERAALASGEPLQ